MDGATDDVSDLLAAPWACGADSLRVEPVAGEPGVLRCPTCGHRTDEAGSGTLSDGFDVVPSPWGLRGDPHAWWAMREKLATTPTPAEEGVVRKVYVDAFREVTGVELDGHPGEYVYVSHLDHGGMSGGAIDLVWWRTRGIPLLSSRAVDRRLPAATPDLTRRKAAPRKQAILGTIVSWLVVLAIPAAAISAGVFLLFQHTSDNRVEATVLECTRSGGIVAGVSTARIECTASWTQDGEVVIGPFNGGIGESDVGKTIGATARGGSAYSRSASSLVMPIVLIALGLLVLAFPVLALRASDLAKRTGSAPSS